MCSENFMRERAGMSLMRMKSLARASSSEIIFDNDNSHANLILAAAKNSLSAFYCFLVRALSLVYFYFMLRRWVGDENKL